MIVKHANPCGVAVGATVEEAYDKALAADPISAYGGVVVLNRAVEAPLGEKLAEQFVEVLFAPGYDEDALDALRRKKNTRILLDGERRAGDPGERTTSACSAACSSRTPTAEIDERDDVGARDAASSDEPQWGDLVFAWRVCKHVASNAIVLAKDLQTIGIGAGQMSRVDAVRIAVEKAREFGHDPTGRRARLRRLLPVPRRPADRPRRRRDRDRPAGRLTRDEDVIAAVARGGRRDGLHRAAATSGTSGAATSYLRGGRISTVECFVVFPPVPVCSVRVRWNRKPPLARSRPRTAFLSFSATRF